MSDDYSPSNKKLKLFERIPRSSKRQCEHLLSLTFGSQDENSEFEEEESKDDSFEDPEYKEEILSDDESDEDVNIGGKCLVRNDASENEDNDDNLDLDDQMSNVSDLSYVKEIVELFNNDSINNDMSDNESVISSYSIHRFRNQSTVSTHGKAILLDVQKKIKNGEYDVAIEYCEHFIQKESPYHHAVYDLLSKSYEALNNYKQMSKYLKTACLLDRVNVQRWSRCIEIFEKVEGVSSAIAIAKQANRWTNGKLRTALIKLLSKSGNEKECLLQRLESYKFNFDFKKVRRSEIDTVVEDLVYLYERFQAMGDMSRFNSTLLILGINYPSYLSTCQKIHLIKVMLKHKNYRRIIDIGKTISGVYIKLTNLSEVDESSGQSALCLQFSKELLSKEDRLDIILGVLLSIVKTNLFNIVKRPEFVDSLSELELDKVKIVLNELYNCSKEYKQVLECVENLLTNLKSKESIIDVLKLKAQCLISLQQNRAALSVYELILSDYTKKDPSVWKNMVELLFKMKEENKAKRVLTNCMDILIKEMNDQNEWSEDEKISSTTGMFFYTLLKHYEKVSSRENLKHYIWHMLWLDSAVFFKKFMEKNICGWNLNHLVNNLAYVNELQCSLVYMMEYKITVDSATSFLARIDVSTPGLKSKVWIELKRLIDMIIDDCHQKNQSEDEIKKNLMILELLCTWGLLLYKLLHWTTSQKLIMCKLLMAVGLQNRLKNVNIFSCWNHDLLFQTIKFLGKNVYTDNIHFWNLYSLITFLMQKFDLKFLMRLIHMYPENVIIKCLNSVYSVHRANKLSFKLCLNMNDDLPENPQTWIQIAIVLSRHATNRNCTDPPVYVKYAVSFMEQYSLLRGECQETHFNLGRFFQGLSIFDRAILHYKKCLRLPSTGMDIRYMAAYNLAGIFRDNRSPLLNSFVNTYLKI